MSTTTTYLRRYTDLPALLHILTAKVITLLDPKTWDDRNDSYFMSLYKERKKLKSILALCFSQSPETYHHWRVFSDGPAGVCIVFDRKSLLASLNKVADVSVGHINYWTIKDAKSRQLTINELPFAKRYGFKPENEYRAIYASTSTELLSLPIAIDIASIRSVSLSPWMHSSLAASTVAAIRAIQDCQKLRISRSTLISNEQWKNLGKSAA